MTKKTQVELLLDARNIDSLFDLMKNHPDELTRLDAAEALGILDDKRGTKEIIRALNNGNPKLQAVARDMLKNLNDAEGNKALADKEDEEDEEQLDAPSQVVIVDFDIPFWSLVMFLVKLSIAAIPATIVVALIFATIGSVIVLVFGAGLGSLLR